uniref:Uncharacterized protein n=1 Tax=Knipowitschia caucasica TaxID=637954 RepID=A0AAV2JHF8_KNICA
MSPMRPGVERVEQPQVGSPSAPFEETEVKSLSLVHSPRDVLVDVRIARLKYEREKERVGAPSCGRTDNTTVYIEKPELITSVSPPPTDKKAGRKFSLAGLVLSCGIPGPTKLLDEVSTEIRQFDPGVSRFLSFMGMALAMLLALQRLHFLLGRLVSR